MKLERASEILDKHGLVDEQTTWEDYLRAVKLGSEALKGIQAVRQLHPELSPFPLLGETEE